MSHINQKISSTQTYYYLKFTTACQRTASYYLCRSNSPRASGLSVDYGLFAGFLDIMQISVQAAPSHITYLFAYASLAPGGSNLSSAISHKSLSEKKNNYTCTIFGVKRKTRMWQFNNSITNQRTFWPWTLHDNGGI